AGLPERAPVDTAADSARVRAQERALLLVVDASGPQAFFCAVHRGLQLRPGPLDEARYQVIGAIAALDLRNAVSQGRDATVRRGGHVSPPQGVTDHGRPFIVELCQFRRQTA